MFFPPGWHCTGFNEVHGEAGLMEDRSLHLVIREVLGVSAREEGLCWKKLICAERMVLSIRLVAQRGRAGGIEREVRSEGREPNWDKAGQ
jgi:hypothetical protein